MYNEYFMYEESDWELFRSKINEWQEKYIQKLNQEYINLLQKEGNTKDNILQLEERIKKDKEHPGFAVSMRKTSMFDNLFFLYKDNILKEEDLVGFSEKLINDLKDILKTYNYNMYNIK